MRENTGFKLGDKYLFVGDILAHYNGYDGYRKIVKRDDKYWVENCSGEVWNEEFSPDEIDEPWELKGDLYNPHYTLVDPKNPTKNTLPYGCDICDEYIGDFDCDTGKSTWFENCGQHTIVSKYCKKHIPILETKHLGRDYSVNDSIIKHCKDNEIDWRNGLVSPMELLIDGEWKAIDTKYFQATNTITVYEREDY